MCCVYCWEIKDCIFGRPVRTLWFRIVQNKRRRFLCTNVMASKKLAENLWTKNWFRLIFLTAFETMKHWCQCSLLHLTEADIYTHFCLRGCVFFICSGFRFNYEYKRRISAPIKQWIFTAIRQIFPDSLFAFCSPVWVRCVLNRILNIKRGFE